MRRRDFIALIGGAGAALPIWPRVARAQQPGRMRRIGVLMALDKNDPDAKAYLSGLRQGLAELGWTDGRNLRMEVRWAAGNVDRARMFAKELVDLQPEMILAASTPVTAALQRETRTIPIVFAPVANPVEAGFVASLPRPGGNLTGFIDLEASLAGKWLELLTEIAPGVKRAAIMFNPDTAPGGGSYFPPAFEAAARSLKVAPVVAPVRSDAEIETVIASLGREPGGGLVVMSDIFMVVHRAPIILLAARNNVPAGLLAVRLCRRRRVAFLRTRPCGHLSPLGVLCRSHPPWCQAGGASGSTADQICDGFEPQDRQGARPCNPAIDSAARRRGDRVSGAAGLGPGCVKTLRGINAP
jgi:putative ABC transport system substrate-binding protein